MIRKNPPVHVRKVWKLKPVTKVKPSKKIYDRNKDKRFWKAIDVHKKLELSDIGVVMHWEGLSQDFIQRAIKVATEFDGVYDLMNLWMHEQGKKERNLILSDIKDMILDCTREFGDTIEG